MRVGARPASRKWTVALDDGAIRARHVENAIRTLLSQPALA
jgi:hypothetical protein